MKVQGRIVVITGSAQGLGKAFARQLLNAGAKVCISDINLEGGNKTLQEFEEIYGATNVHFVKCDVTKEEEMKALYDGAEEYFGGKVSIFCNNAGINHTAGWKKCMDIDIMAVMAGTYMAMERMSLKNGGSGGLIINTASLAGILFGDGSKELAQVNSYFVAKHGVVALTRALGNKEILAETGVQLRCICPSFADTNIIREGIEDPDQARERINKLGGVMTPEFVSEGFYSLVTEGHNGDAMVVAKDTNFIIFPDISFPLLIFLAAGSKIFGSKVFRPKQQILFALFTIIVLHCILWFLLSMIF